MSAAMTMQPPENLRIDSPVTRYAIPFPTASIVVRYLLEGTHPPCLQYQEELRNGGLDMTSDALRDQLIAHIESKIVNIPWENVDTRYRTTCTHANTLYTSIYFQMRTRYEYI